MSNPGPVDPWARLRAEFYLPPDQIYLDGNSLGLLSRRAEQKLLQATADWRRLGVDGWTEAKPAWLDWTERVAAQLAPLLGAAPDEVAVTGQTTVNLHQLLATLYDPAAPRRTILADPLNFASDLHALQSHLSLRGLDPAIHLKLAPTRDGMTLRTEDLVAAMTPEVQLALFPAVLFASGQLLDLEKLTRAAHERGILIGFDCSHSIGAVAHDFGRIAPDFACWCHYKYLNAGPGAIGGLYLNRRHFHRPPGLAGWWGVRADRRFAMHAAHEPAAGAAGLHIGTPSMLALAPLAGSLELIAEAGGVAALRARSLALTHALRAEIERELSPHGFTVVTPRPDSEHGGHLALAHPDAWRICQALKAAGVVPDFRPPNLIRLAPAPLCNTEDECREAVFRLRTIMLERRPESFPPSAQPAP
ncbi:MAG: kynureninase [Opitutaceae bacterium]|nr:kynureninase [Opitutaceae bacterium]